MVKKIFMFANNFTERKKKLGKNLFPFTSNSQFNKKIKKQKKKNKRKNCFLNVIINTLSTI